ncbi:uncharacterized protein LOC119109437 [Pollicipes pollicipes]|uniref:uncharacterized protein LOC119107523 n=1 Tax=Pollicipes pollicipes TaxID=41117 RepID=UPI001885943B|nr:uncharacterized protein LOC119107523 [Pollicipes pollicipes]XP_037088953.1 uncharacterized protein LOC119109437 [Pollicipes pollicipes]
MASLRLIALGLLAVVVITEALPVPQSVVPDDVAAGAPEEARLKREGPPVRLQAQARDDSYGQPAYAPAPSYHHKGGPVYVKTFVKTDYDGNFKWGVKHNIENKGYH